MKHQTVYRKSVLPEVTTKRILRGRTLAVNFKESMPYELRLRVLRQNAGNLGLKFQE